MNQIWFPKNEFNWVPSNSIWNSMKPNEHKLWKPHLIHWFRSNSNLNQPTKHSSQTVLLINSDRPNRNGCDSQQGIQRSHAQFGGIRLWLSSFLPHSSPHPPYPTEGNLLDLAHPNYNPLITFSVWPVYGSIKKRVGTWNNRKLQSQHLILRYRWLGLSCCKRQFPIIPTLNLLAWTSNGSWLLGSLWIVIPYTERSCRSVLYPFTG